MSSRFLSFLVILAHAKNFVALETYINGKFFMLFILFAPYSSKSVPIRNSDIFSNIEISQVYPCTSLCLCTLHVVLSMPLHNNRLEVLRILMLRTAFCLTSSLPPHDWLANLTELSFVTPPSCDNRFSLFFNIQTKLN